MHWGSLVFVWGLLAAPAQAAAPPPRVAVLVGTNSAVPGRQPLLYGHRDAHKLADALMAVGGFRREDVTVLQDPSPAEVVTALRARIAQVANQPDSLFYFYYSGHADEWALYPGGKRLAVDSLRRVLDEAPISVKVGMVDACRGGAWTRAKGLAPEEPFALSWPMGLDNEGSVLIASSSGLESAHESEHLQGSFFTYHFTAGLRGAADRNGDRQITLTEVFEYAKERTIHDTVKLTTETQHPSYAVNLRGRRDLVLGYVAASPSTVEVTQAQGPLQIIHADTGVALLELPEGRRTVTLAVPPGRYLVRKQGRRNRVREVIVVAGAKNYIDEADLTLMASPKLAVKAVAPPPEREDVGTATKVGAFGTAAAAVIALGLGIKFAVDVKSINEDLEPYRRFPCPPGVSSPGGCKRDGSEAYKLSAAELEYVRFMQDDGARMQDLRNYSLVAGAVLATISGVLFIRWDHKSATVTTDLSSASLRLTF